MPEGQQGSKNLLIRAVFGLQTAVSGVMSQKLRSLLTVLGVMIGVASLLVLLAIGHGAREAVAQQFESLGANLIKVSANHWNINFEIGDGTEMTERVPAIIDGMPLLRSDEVQLRYRRMVDDVAVIGVTENMPQVRDHKVVAGRFFSHLHVQERMRVAVLGYEAWRSIFGDANPIGQGIYLEGQRFTVIGVLSRKGTGMADDIDQQIVLPITSAQRVLLTGRVDELWLKAADAGSVDPSMVQLSRILRYKFNLRDAEDDDEEEGFAPAAAGSSASMAPGGHFMGHPGHPEQEGPPLTITSLNALIEEASEASRVMTMMLAGIASVALLVGGLGIMNIMLVSVSERTREIGIRKALGAHPVDLVYQFMMEALILSITGGALGVAAGYVGAGLASRYGLETLMTSTASGVAFCAAVGVGILFGVYPAYVASQLQPVEALRHR